MTSECTTFLRALEEGGGGADEVWQHLESCPRCRRHEALLSVLASLPAAATDEEAVRAIIRALPRPAWQLRRLVTWIPAACGAALAGFGLWLLGGVPAAGSMPALDGAPQGLVSWVFAWVLDLAATIRSASEAVTTVVAAGGIGVIVWLVLLGLGGGWLAYGLVRRRSGGRG